MGIFLSLLTLYVSMWGRSMLPLLWLWHPPQETHLTPLSFHLLTRQSLYINALLILPGPGHLVPGLAVVCIPAPSHQAAAPVQPPRLTTTPICTHSTCSGPSNDFCTDCLGRREDWKAKEAEGPWLTLEEKNYWYALHYWHPLPPMTETPSPFLSYWLNENVLGSNSTNTMGFFSGGNFWERTRERFPKDLVRRNAVLWIISRGPYSFCRAIKTEHQRPGSLNNRYLFSHLSGGQEFKVKVSVGLVSPEASPLHL